LDFIRKGLFLGIKEVLDWLFFKGLCFRLNVLLDIVLVEFYWILDIVIFEMNERIINGKI
jgi:hypothetical protein